jgi:RNA polymerase sigma factor (sigma-70 family)
MTSHRTASHRTSSERITEQQVTALVNGYRSGDESCLPPLMRALTPLIRHAARRSTKSADDIDDVVQETWITFVRKVHTLETPERLSGWLWTTANNLARKMAMKSSRTIASDKFESIGEAVGRDSTDSLFEQQRLAALLIAVASLEDRDQHLMRLLMSSEEHSYKTLSALSGRPIGSLGPSRDRLIHRLQKDPNLAKLAYAS